MTPLNGVLNNLKRGPVFLPLAVALLILGASQVGGGAVLADPARREAIQRQQAEAMSRLSTSQRQQYFAARRNLEQRSANQRLEQLSQAERCIVAARDVAAVESCQRSQQQQAMQQRRQQMADLAELQRRFGLPGWGKGAGQQLPAPTKQAPQKQGA
jgi:type IV secretory pathway TrbL component